MSYDTRRFEELISRVKTLCLCGQQIPDSDMEALLKWSTYAEDSYREASLSFLLAPPVADGPFYCQSLMRFLSQRKVAVRDLPQPLYEFILETIQWCGQIPWRGNASSIFVRAVHHLPRRIARTLVKHSWSLVPYLEHVNPFSLVPCPRRWSRQNRRRWRLLRKQLIDSFHQPSWAQVTLSDLSLIFLPSLPHKRSQRGPGYHLRCARTLVLPIYQGKFSKLDKVGFSKTHWRGAGNLRKQYMEKLLCWQAEELRAGASLAEKASESTRRVVLSLHNATLAAMSGWAYPGLSRSFPSVGIWKDYLRAVMKRFTLIRSKRKIWQRALELYSMRTQRLVLPKVMHCLWHERYKKPFRIDSDYLSNTFMIYAADLLGIPISSLSEEPAGWGFPAAVAPHQQPDLTTILSFHQKKSKTWPAGLALLCAILEEGQALLEKGVLSHFVVPWIDKFFISSRRDEDSVFLSALVEWFLTQGLRPVVLLFEDTVHATDPSLKIAIEKMAGKGCPCRGIGVFDHRPSSRSEALKIICEEAERTILFALRPYSDLSDFHSLDELLMNLDHEFFKRYDSSWKDNLCFIYAGTQVSDLLTASTDREDYASWIAAGNQKVPFGAFLRHNLRSRVLARPEIPEGSFSFSYAWWANLC